jgi:hypothetical protein
MSRQVIGDTFGGAGSEAPAERMGVFHRILYTLLSLQGRVLEGMYMQMEGQSEADVIRVKPHLNRNGNLVTGHWRTRPRFISGGGRFRGLAS